MNSNIITFFLFISTLGLAALHKAALVHGWYYFYPWVDIPIHTLGGFAVALLVYMVLVLGITPEKIHSQTSVRVLFVMVFGTFWISIVWEVLELVFFLTKDAGLSIETFSDIVFGVLGSIVAWGLVVFLSRKKSITISNQQ